MRAAKRKAFQNLTQNALPSGQSASSLAKLCLQGASSPPGLINHSNSCFQNSTVQALAGLEPLRDYLVWIGKEQKRGGLGNAPLAEALGRFLNSLFEPANVGKTLVVPKVLKALDDAEQQDAQEYFLKFIGELETELMKAMVHAQQKHNLAPGFGLSPSSFRTTSVSPSSFDNSNSDTELPTFGEKMTLGAGYSLPFMGYVGDQVICTECGYSLGVGMNSFSSLSLDLDLGRKTQDLHHLLAKFTAIDSIEDVQCSKCTIYSWRRKLQKKIEENKSEALRKMLADRLHDVETAIDDGDFQDETLDKKCKIPPAENVRTTKTKQTAIASAPASLALHISRTQMDMMGRYVKNDSKVSFPTRLDLGPYMLESSSPQSQNGDVIMGKRNGNAIAPSSSMNKSDDDEKQQQPTTPSGPIYELQALVAHKGSHNRGHYVSCRKQIVISPPKDEDEKDEKDEKDAHVAEPREISWWYFSDEVVQPMLEEEVLRMSGVTMLYYDRIDNKAVYDSSPLQEAIARVSAEDAAKGESRATQEPSSEITDITATAQIRKDSTDSNTTKPSSRAISSTPTVESSPGTSVFSEVTTPEAANNCTSTEDAIDSSNPEFTESDAESRTLDEEMSSPEAAAFVYEESSENEDGDSSQRTSTEATIKRMLLTDQLFSTDADRICNERSSARCAKMDVCSETGKTYNGGDAKDHNSTGAASTATYTYEPDEAPPAKRTRVDI